MRTIYSKSLIDKDTEAYLWDSAIIVFDTCALLDFYYMTKENQEIIADILKTLSARIWLPAQVFYEFKKNHPSESCLRVGLVLSAEQKDKKI